MYLTYRPTELRLPRQAGAWEINGVRITDAMSRAGANCLRELREADLDLFYVVQEVFLAMLESQRGEVSRPPLSHS
jgi:hypothetical protein